MLVGNIGSGKSALVKELAKRGYIVVCRDSLRYMAGGGSYVFDVDLEPVLFKVEKYTLKVLTDAGYDIVIDETNMSRYIRDWHFSAIKDKGYNVTALILPKVSKEESIKRRLKDNHGDTDAQVWGDVWDRFNKVYIEPSKDEGFTKIVHLKEGFTHETLRNI